MTDTAQTERPGARSPRKAIMVSLAVLLVLWYLFPGAVVGWLEDRCDTEIGYCAAFDGLAQGVDSASRSLGVAGALEDWRDQIRTALGIDSY
jgi:hypothetical protein